MKEAHAREPQEIKDYPREDWVNDSNGGETDLNYWDWVAFRMTTENGEYPLPDVSLKEQHLDLIQDIWEQNMLPKHIVDNSPRMFRVRSGIQYRAEVLSACRFSEQKENIASWRLWVSKAAIVLSLGKGLDNTISRLTAYQILNKYRPEVVAPRSTKKDTVVDAEPQVMDVAPAEEGEDLGGMKYQVPEFDEGVDNEAEGIKLIREARGEDFFKGHENNAMVADHCRDWMRRVDTFTALISVEDMAKPWGKWLLEADLEKFKDPEFRKLAWDPHGIVTPFKDSQTEEQKAIQLIEDAQRNGWFRGDRKTHADWCIHVLDFLPEVSEESKATDWYSFLDHYSDVSNGTTDMAELGYVLLQDRVEKARVTE